MNISKLPLCLIALTMLAACGSMAPVSTPTSTATTTKVATATATATTKPTENPTPILNFEKNPTRESCRDSSLVTVDFTKPDSVANFDKVIGQYSDWLDVQAQNYKFDETKVKPLFFKKYSGGFWSTFIYPSISEQGIDTSNPSQTPWALLDCKQIMVLSPDGVSYPEMLETYVLHTKDKNYKVTLDRTYYEPGLIGKSMGADELNKIVDRNIEAEEQNNFLPILIIPFSPGAQENDPVAVHVQSKFDTDNAINQAAQGDIAALDQKGLIFLTSGFGKIDSPFQPGVNP